MSAVDHHALEVVLGVVALWLALGAASLAQGTARAVVRRVVFPVGAAGALVMAGAALRALGDPATTLVLPLGLPGLPFHFRLDALSTLFLVLLGLVSFAVSIHAIGYFRGESASRLRLLGLQYHCFLASMALVILADDAYLFMVAWEAMALSSYFLVTTDHRQAVVRDAGFLYLLIAHVGALALLLCFGVLHGGGGFERYTFDAMRAAGVSGNWQTVAFLLALVGFGAKAGVVPLHAWLPEAHPAAPSPVSALMSAVMLKTAIYGLVRVTFDLIGAVRWEWGLGVALLGAASALFGILYALQQHDLKRLLAYSSVENVGVILMGLGMAMVFFDLHQPLAGTLGLVAALYHALNHAMVKALLFLGAGSVLHAAGTRNLNHMGGLIRRMPAVAFYFLVGALAISALPPLNGFVSEWLILQTALRAGDLGNGVLRSILPLLAALLVLSAALTARCFVKAYGTAFLGRPRDARRDRPGAHEAGDAGLAERIAMAWLAAWCVVLGVFPTLVVPYLNHVVLTLTGASLPNAALDAGRILLVPSEPGEASYAPLVFLLVIGCVVALTWMVVRRRSGTAPRRAPPWDCGFPEQTPRMQDSADAFGQSIRMTFAPLYRMTRKVPGPDEAHPRFELKVEDRLWYALYLPVGRLVAWVSGRIGRLQHGRISVYLLYSFVTLIALLVFVR